MHAYIYNVMSRKILEDKKNTERQEVNQKVFSKHSIFQILKVSYCNETFQQFSHCQYVRFHKCCTNLFFLNPLSIDTLLKK